MLPRDKQDSLPRFKAPKNHNSGNKTKLSTKILCQHQKDKVKDLSLYLDRIKDALLAVGVRKITAFSPIRVIKNIIGIAVLSRIVGIKGADTHTKVTQIMSILWKIL